MQAADSLDLHVPTLDATPEAFPNARDLSGHTQRVIEIRILPLGAWSGGMIWAVWVGGELVLKNRKMFTRRDESK